MVILIFSILFACTHLSAGECKTHTIEIINSIPKKDREEIKSLFKYLFKTQTFAYSLYGDKPMAYSDISLEESSLSELLEMFPIEQCCREILEIYSEPRGLIKRRWEIWKKYNNRFKMKKYLLIEKQIGRRIRIFLINKEAFKDVVNQSIDLFQKIIGKEISAEELLAQFQLKNTNVFDILHNNESLLGILLGFGQHNAMLFQRREDLLDHLERKKTSGIYELEHIQNELNLANSKLQPLREHDPYIIASIHRVCFAADPKHYETIKLRTKYDKLNRKINEIYSKDDWFNQTLIQLTSD